MKRPSAWSTFANPHQLDEDRLPKTTWYFVCQTRLDHKRNK